MTNSQFLKQTAISFLITVCFHPANAAETGAITFAWEWNAGSSGYSSGPDGDIAFRLYMRTEDDAGYDYDYPTITGIDNCWLEAGLFHCQVTLSHEFEPGISYFFSVTSYLVNDHLSVSTLSNEIQYMVETPDIPNQNNRADVEDHDKTNSQSSVLDGAGGGCFINSGLTLH